MNGFPDCLPCWLEFLGFAGTILGTGLAGLSLLWAILAARRALDASQQAKEAKHAAIRLGRIARLEDLMADMQELETMSAEADFHAVARKADRLRGRVARFKEEAYTVLTGDERASLDLAREQLKIIQQSALGKAAKENKRARIQKGYGEAYEAVNRVFGVHKRVADED